MLDNFEQLIEAAPILAELLNACPKLKILVTSRTVLHLYGEHELAINPLNIPSGYLPTPLEHYELARLSNCLCNVLQRLKQTLG